MKYLSLFSGLGLGLFLTACASGNSPVQHSPMPVAASFYPLAYFAEQVGDGDVTVTSVTPGGVEPHDYEPTPQEIVQVQNAKVFVSNGNGLDPWADKILPDLQKKGTTTVRMTDHFDLLKAGSTQENIQKFPYDPHIWLDPALAKKEVELIRDAFITADPAHAADYRKNADALLAKFDALDAEYRSGLAQCALKDIVVSHDAFEYLGKRYGIHSIALAGLSPDEEPSPKVMADIADQARMQKIDYIFFETLASPKLSQALANEIGARTLVLNPLEGLTDQEKNAGETYFTVMQKNLQNLRTAMQCQ